MSLRPGRDLIVDSGPIPSDGKAQYQPDGRASYDDSVSLGAAIYRLKGLSGPEEESGSSLLSYESGALGSVLPRPADVQSRYRGQQTRKRMLRAAASIFFTVLTYGQCKAGGQNQCESPRK